MAVHEGVAHSYGEAGGNKYASSAQRPSAPTIHHVIMPGRGGGSISGGGGQSVGAGVLHDDPYMTPLGRSDLQSRSA